MTTATIVARAWFGTVRPQRWMCDLKMHIYLMTITSVPVGSLEKKILSLLQQLPSTSHYHYTMQF